MRHRAWHTEGNIRSRWPVAPPPQTHFRSMASGGPVAGCHPPPPTPLQSTPRPPGSSVRLGTGGDHSAIWFKAAPQRWQTQEIPGSQHPTQQTADRPCKDCMGAGPGTGVGPAERALDRDPWWNQEFILVSYVPSVFRLMEALAMLQ